MANDVNFNLNLAIEQFKSATQEAKSLTKDLSSTYQTSTKQMSSSWAFFTAGIQLEVFKKAASFLSEMFTAPIEAAAEAEVAMNKLKQSMNVTGTYTKEAALQVEEFANQMSKASIYEDDLIIKNVALARSFGMSTAQAEQATQAAAALSAVFGGNLESNTEMLAKTLTGVLPRGLGVSVRELKNLTAEQLRAGAAFDIVNKKFGSAAVAELNTFTGQTALLHNQYKKLQESLGAVVLESGALQSIMTSAIGVVIQLQEAVKGVAHYYEQNQANIKTFGIALGSSTAIILTATTAMWALNSATGVFAGIMAVIFSPITLVVAAIAALSAVIFAAIKYWDYITIGILTTVKAYKQVELAALAAGKAIGLPLSDQYKSKAEQIKAYAAEIDALKEKIKKKNEVEATPVKVEAAKKASTTDALKIDRAAEELNAKEILRIKNQSAIDIQQANRESNNALAQQDSEYANSRASLAIEASKMTLEEKNNANIALMEQRALQQEQELLDLQTQEQNKLAILTQAEMDKALLIADSEQKKKAIADANTKAQLAQTNLNNKQALDTAKLQNTNQLKIEEARVKSQQQLDQERVSNQRDTFSTIATLSQSNNKTLAAIGKAAGITQIAIDTPVAISKALAAFPPPFNFVAAGLVGTAMAAQAARIAGLNFANGGIVPGSSFSGDRVPANVNSGEMILNRQQQAQLFNMANGEGNNSGFIDAINKLGDRIANLEIKLWTSDSNIALATSRGVQDGVLLGASR